jgi:hypothetical protein
LDAVLYEHPFVSVYLLLASLHCIKRNSVGLVPAYFFGYILILYGQSYHHYVASETFNFGYTPLTIQEVAKALITGGKNAQFEPVTVVKRTKRRTATGKSDEQEDEDDTLEPLNHREFPYSEKTAYPKLGVEDALAPSSGKNAKGRTALLCSCTR